MERFMPKDHTAFDALDPAVKNCYRGSGDCTAYIYEVYSKSTVLLVQDGRVTWKMMFELDDGWYRIVPGHRIAIHISGQPAAAFSGSSAAAEFVSARQVPAPQRLAIIGGADVRAETLVSVKRAASLPLPFVVIGGGRICQCTSSAAPPPSSSSAGSILLGFVRSPRLNRLGQQGQDALMRPSRRPGGQRREGARRARSGRPHIPGEPLRACKPRSNETRLAAGCENPRDWLRGFHDMPGLLREARNRGRTGPPRWTQQTGRDRRGDTSLFARRDPI